MNNVQGERALADRFISYLRAELRDPALELAAPLVRLEGGYETSTYRFQLDGAPDELDRPLVLRLYPLALGTETAVWESAVQNGLAREGYPVARAHVLCTDVSVLGGAFFVMDYLPGVSLATAPQESVPRLLGQTQAKLHGIDSNALVKWLADQGIARQGYTFASRFDWLCERAKVVPWVRPGMDWLRQHRPPDPERLSVCHGDFHPLNVMVDQGAVTGILDWGGLALADPAYDVGNTLVLLTIAVKNLAASMGLFPGADFDHMAESYLAAYRAQRPLESTHLDYFRARRCVQALVEGAEGQEVWQHPSIVRDLLACIHEVTGMRIEMAAIGDP
jgi:aminoglycoside phosphotransferase (APT) family kinase protein